MAIDIKVPELGESIVEATVGEWHKQEGDLVAVGDILVELETDKVDVEVGAESAGTLVKILKHTGQDVQIGEALGKIDPDRQGEQEAMPTSTTQGGGQKGDNEIRAKPEPSIGSAKATPVAMRLVEENNLNLHDIGGSGPNGRITREDVEKYLQQKERIDVSEPPAAMPMRIPAPENQGIELEKRVEAKEIAGERREERIRMSRRRRTIAHRLVEAQQSAAMLTTFNDIDMSAIMALRKRHGESFIERHGVKLGYMSFFVKSVIGALKAYPRLNAEIDGDEMVLKYYYDIGIAVGAEEGLVVPVVRDADRRSFAEIEKEILNLAQKVREGNLSLDELRGGTFTITNGGIFGSLLSTPILNTPQVGILGMHRIEERPIAFRGEVVIRPMMYLALSYDHRIVDGREAVQFLSRVKELIEDPETLLLDG